MVTTIRARSYVATGWVAILLLGCCLLSVSAQTPTQEQVKQLRQEITTQQASLEEQKKKLDELLRRLEALEGGKVPAKPTADAQPPAPVQSPEPGDRSTAKVKPTPPPYERDPVGDLRAESIREGEIPGSILLPGKGISIAIGGFIKTLAYYDTKAENRGAIVFPSTLGALGRDDRNGGFGISGELTRMSVDARANAGSSKFRGYIEWDFNSGSFTLRHGYLTWDDRWGQILAGKYWSNFMDLNTLPEAFTEPILSGAPFARQAQVRYTRNFAKNVTWSISAEDPSSNDVLAAEPLLVRKPFPDLISTISFQGKRAHIKFGGLLRRITVDNNNEENFSTTGWGVHASGHVDLFKKDKLAVIFVTGEGLGRYLLGLSPSSGAFVIPETREIIPRRAYGTFGWYRHRWNAPCRSTAGAGYTTVQTDARQSDDALRASLFGIANLMCSVNKYVTIGGEYSYGQRWNRVGNLNNNRFTFGIQVF